MGSASQSKPTVLIIRDKKEWPSDEFLTLFAEEGYDTLDADEHSLASCLGAGEPFGVMGKLPIASN